MLLKGPYAYDDIKHDIQYRIIYLFESYLTIPQCTVESCRWINWVSENFTDTFVLIYYVKFILDI